MLIFWQTSEPWVIRARLRSSDKYITRYPAQLKRHANDFQHRRGYYSRPQRRWPIQPNTKRFFEDRGGKKARGRAQETSRTQRERRERERNRQTTFEEFIRHCHDLLSRPLRAEEPFGPQQAKYLIPPGNTALYDTYPGPTAQPNNER